MLDTRPVTVASGAGAASIAVPFASGATVVSQGEDCSDIHYVETGFVKLTVVSKRGKGAVLGMLGAGDFFGEACIGGDTVYSSTAIAVTPTSVWFMPGKIMLRTLRENSTFAMEFISYLLRRDRLIDVRAIRKA